VGWLHSYKNDADQASNYKVFAVETIFTYLHMCSVQCQRAQVLNAACNNNNNNSNMKGLQVWLVSHHSVSVISCKNYHLWGIWKHKLTLRWTVIM